MFSSTIVSTSPQCRLCSSPDIENKGKKRGRFVKEDFTFYRCRACGYVFVEPVTDPGIYNDAYYAGKGPDPIVNYHEEYTNYRATARRYELAGLVRLVRKHVCESMPDDAFKNGINWLDFGCGAGGLLKYLRDLGQIQCGIASIALHPAGHDVGVYSERLKNIDGFDILSLKDLRENAEARFDIITCIEVIEHIPFPREAVGLLAHCLRPGGLLILTTGNMDSPLARLQGINFPYCIPEIHVSLFTPSLLRRLYREFGLVPINARIEEMLKFRFLKTLGLIPGGKNLAWLASFSPALRFADYVFGVSKIPFAVKAKR